MTELHESKKTVDFSGIGEMQDRTLAAAVNNNLPWLDSDYVYLADNMFDRSIEEIAEHLGRSAYSIATVLSKNETFINLREAHGTRVANHTVGTSTKQQEGRDNRLITSDANLLFNFGD